MERKITDYLNTVVSLEKSLYTQNQAISKISQEIDKLGIPKSFREPYEPTESSGFQFDSLKICIGIFGFLGAIIGLFSGNFLAGALIGILAGGMLYLIVRSLMDNSENKQEMENYHNEMAAYNRAVSNDAARVEQEIEEANRLCEILSVMEDKRDQTAALLQQYYAMGFVFPKYRNMIAVCSICEYFLSGACDTMKEAYNKYDNEVLLKQIITKLDDILVSLDSIRDTQFMLYNAIQEGNQISHQLVAASVEQSKLLQTSIDYQALNAVYSEQTRNELRFQNDLIVYNAWQHN